MRIALLSLVALLATPASAAEAVPAAAPPAPPVTSTHPWTFGVWGALPLGEHFSTAISPKGAAYQVNEPDRSWSFGLVIEYALSPALRLFLDGGMYAQSAKVADKGGMGTSFWVYEQTGYSSHDVGPFAEGVRYYTDTTALRLGGSYGVPMGPVRAWLGATAGLYAWQATYGTPDRSGKWGQVSGKVVGFTVMAGADYPITDSILIGLYTDLASPAAEGEMKDLFNAGWDWTVAHHVMGPYRFGVRLLTTM